jgi:hypothetical protein
VKFAAILFFGGFIFTDYFIRKLPLELEKVGAILA